MTEELRNTYLKSDDAYRLAFEEGFWAATRLLPTPHGVLEDVKALIEMRRYGTISAQQFIVDVEDFIKSGSET